MRLFGQIRKPAPVDLHVHIRQVGFAYQGTTCSGSLAAKRAGGGNVFTMPNVPPTPNYLDHLAAKAANFTCDNHIGARPSVSITLCLKGEGELVYKELSAFVLSFLKNKYKGPIVYEAE